ncbi:MAG: hypothetical protein RSD95_03800 [Clostridia bacterium]
MAATEAINVWKNGIFENKVTVNVRGDHAVLCETWTLDGKYVHINLPLFNKEDITELEGLAAYEPKDGEECVSVQIVCDGRTTSFITPEYRYNDFFFMKRTNLCTMGNEKKPELMFSDAEAGAEWVIDACVAEEHKTYEGSDCTKFLDVSYGNVNGMTFQVRFTFAKDEEMIIPYDMQDETFNGSGKLVSWDSYLYGQVMFS